MASNNRLVCELVAAAVHQIDSVLNSKAALGDRSSLSWMNGIIFNVSLEIGNQFYRAQRSPAARGVEQLMENYKPFLPCFVMNGSGQGFHFGFPECALTVYSFGGSPSKEQKLIHVQLFRIQ